MDAVNHREDAVSAAAGPIEADGAVPQPGAGLPRSASSGHPMRASHVVERVVDGKLVLYNLSSQRVHVLNPTAAFIWSLCDGMHSDDELVTELVGHYPESASTIPTDVAELLRLLTEDGLVAG